MKNCATYIKEVSKLGIRVIPMLVIGALIIFNISVNLSVSATSNDDPDSSASGQSNFASNPNKNLTRATSWEPAVFDAPATGKNEIVPLFAVYNHTSGVEIYKDSVLNLQLRGPPPGLG